MKKKSSESAFVVLVKRISELGEPFEAELDEADLARILSQADGDYHTVGDGVGVHLELRRAGDNVFVRGDLELSVATVCGRCLADLTHWMQILVDWTFLPAAEYRSTPAEGGEVELSGEDLDVSFYEGEEIDIGELVREAILLELEPYPTCPDDCSGKDMEPFIDEEAKLDPRWLPLLQIKRRQQS